MKKHYIYFATNDNDKAVIFTEILEDFSAYYNCNTDIKAYKRIYDFWDQLDKLSMEEQSNTLVIFDPGIYKNIPKLVTNNAENKDSTNYWHKLKNTELFPWYELVLRYPLVTPMFLTYGNNLFEEEEYINSFCYIDLKSNINKQLEDNITLFLDGFRTWFDPFGLRESWRNKVLQAMFEDTYNNLNTNENKYHKNKTQNNSKTKKTIYCIEDEIEYALFSGYTAYKCGTQVNIVDSYKVLEWARNDIKDKKIENVGIIRDLDLRFRDHTRDIENRNSLKTLEGLGLFPKDFDNDKKESFSYLVISYYNHNHQNSLKKPLNSLYEVVKKSDILNIEEKRLLSISDNNEISNNNDGKNHHAAPYLNMQLATDILTIALKSTNSYTELVFKSLLYMEAYMLLQLMAPTTSMQILKNLHLAELNFELSFIGIDNNQTIKDRKEDIEKDIDNLLKETKSREQLKESFLISFWNDAKTIYKKHEQFNAAEEANNEAMILIKW